MGIELLKSAAGEKLAPWRPPALLGVGKLV